MALTVPSSDTVHYNLQQQITAVATLITNNSSNGALVAKLTRDKANLQNQLVSSLIGSGRISCASILTNETYITGAIPDGV